MPSYESSAASGVRVGGMDRRRGLERVGSHRVRASTVRSDRGPSLQVRRRVFRGAKLTVTRVERPRLWVDESHSPGKHMTFDHVIEQVEDGTRLTERVDMHGALAFLVGPLLRRRLEALFTASVTHVARTAEAALNMAEPLAS
jgi:hypothetical protein